MEPRFSKTSRSSNETSDKLSYGHLLRVRTSFDDVSSQDFRHQSIYSLAFSFVALLERFLESIGVRAIYTILHSKVVRWRQSCVNSISIGSKTESL